MKLQEKIEKYLVDALDGDTTISDEIIERFGERCKEALSKNSIVTRKSLLYVCPQ